MLSLIAALALTTSLTLEGNTDALEVVTTTTASTDYVISWSNVTATALTTPGTSAGNINTATTTTVVAAPSASNWRHIRGISIRNANAVSNGITVQVDRSGSNRTLYSTTLSPGEALTWEETGGWRVYNSAGSPKVQSDPQGFSGRTLSFTKLGTAIDTIGYHYAYSKDVGFPGAATFAAPGLNGANFACDSAAGAAVPGSHVLADPATGGWYLTRFGLTSAVVDTFELVDFVWYNTGLAVATTTAQAITTAAFPARDVNGSANGEGYRIALLTTTANTNAGAIANTTVNYTNSNGTASRTATFSGTAGFQAPATPVVGTWMPFLLQAGDTGVRSIQGVTLGTSYAAGALSLIVYRPLMQTGVSAANFPSGDLMTRIPLNPGVRIWNDTCFQLTLLGAPAVTAAGVYGGTIELMER